MTTLAAIQLDGDRILLRDLVRPEVRAALSLIETSPQGPLGAEIHVCVVGMRDCCSCKSNGDWCDGGTHVLLQLDVPSRKTTAKRSIFVSAQAPLENWMKTIAWLTQ